MKKVLFSAMVLLALSFSAMAQESNIDANGNRQYGPYETNKFFDNWFISVGGGANYIVDGMKKGGWNGKVKPVIDVNLGKWIDPCFGVRLGYEGWQAETKWNKMNYNHVHGDFLWNISNQFGGYKETRFWDFIPYAHAGVVFDKKMGTELAAGIGLLNKLRLSNTVGLFLDLRAGVLQGEQFNVPGRAGLASATFGLTVNLGKNNWTRKATTVAGYEALLAAAKKPVVDESALNAANAKLKAANDKNAQLENEIANLKKALQEKKEYEAAHAPEKAPLVVYFKMGKAILSDAELVRISEFVKGLMNNTKVVVAGGSDTKTGTQARNAALRAERAEYVKNLLEKTYGMTNVTITDGVQDYSSPELSRIAIITLK